MSEEESRKGPDEVIHELGGCGRFQIRMSVLVHLMKTLVCWSLVSMVFVTASPEWWCGDGDNNITDAVNNTLHKSCKTVNGTPCSNYEFATDMRTIVGEVSNWAKVKKCKICGSTPFCACGKSHPGICSPSNHSVISCDSVCGQQRP